MFYIDLQNLICKLLFSIKKGICHFEKKKEIKKESGKTTDLPFQGKPKQFASLMRFRGPVLRHQGDIMIKISPISQIIPCSYFL